MKCSSPCMSSLPACSSSRRMFQKVVTSGLINRAPDSKRANMAGSEANNHWSSCNALHNLQQRENVPNIRWIKVTKLTIYEIYINYNSINILNKPQPYAIRTRCAQQIRKWSLWDISVSLAHINLYINLWSIYFADTMAKLRWQSKAVLQAHIDTPHNNRVIVYIPYLSKYEVMFLINNGQQIS